MDGGSYLEDELVQVQKIVVDEFLHLPHVEVHLAAVARHQVRTQQQRLRPQQLQVVDLVLLYNKVALLLNTDRFLLDQPHPRGQELVDLGVDVQTQFPPTLDGVVGEPDPHEVIEEHPLVRVELGYLHQRDHLDQLQGSPVLVELVLNCRGVEGLGQQKYYVLPDSGQQLCQLLGRRPQDQDPDAEEDEDEHGTRHFGIFGDLDDLVDQLLGLVSVLILLASVQDKTDTFERLDLLLGLEGVAAEQR